MKWKAEQLTCTPPGYLLPHRQTTILVNGEPTQVIWLPEQSSLQVIDDHGVERRIRVRSFGCERASDPSQLDIKLEAFSASDHPGLATFTLTPDVPGQEARAARAAAAGAQIKSPITGKVLQVLVKEADLVAAGAVIAIIEAMKMENKILAPIAGRIKDLAASPGQSISTGALICRIGPTDDA